MNRTILSVEDDENDRLFLKLALEDVGLANELQMVVDGKQAMDYLNNKVKIKAGRQPSSAPGMVLLDLNLPFISGFEILAWMRSETRFESTIIIPLSSSGLAEDVTRAKKFGADDYLIKPATLDGWRRIGLQLAEQWFDQRLKTRMPFVRAAGAAAQSQSRRAYKAQAS
jgi:DNA-binding response OmpR family regulator